MFEVDWESDESHAFINPRLMVEPISSPLKGHILLTTSGTESLKWVALSKKALLTSADAVNRHIGATTKDIWINALPHFHVGGLSIYARAYLGKTFVWRFDAKWNAKEWAQFVEEKRGSLTSLVPTQLWDLVQQGIAPPKWLRVIFIGGQDLPSELYERAKKAGWPIVPTFGMTEMSSQIATATLDDPTLRLLSHVEAKVDGEGRLSLKSPALFTCYFDPDFRDPKQEGWFTTDDRVALNEGLLTPLGRFRDVIKINGEQVALFQLEKLLNELKFRLGVTADTALVPEPDPRSGHRLHLFHTPYDVAPLLALYNAQVPPFSRISGATELASLPKTALGKVALPKLQEGIESR